MNVFLDTSVVLAACASRTGASREVCLRSTPNAWTLIVTPYVIAETEANLPDLQSPAASEWEALRSRLAVTDDVLTLDRPAVFGPAKDRPILFSALAWADVLLTLDRNDFGSLMGRTFYGLRVMRPGGILGSGTCRRTPAVIARPGVAGAEPDEVRYLPTSRRHLRQPPADVRHRHHDRRRRRPHAGQGARPLRDAGDDGSDAGEMNRRVGQRLRMDSAC